MEEFAKMARPGATTVKKAMSHLSSAALFSIFVIGLLPGGVDAMKGVPRAAASISLVETSETPALPPVRLCVRDPADCKSPLTRNEDVAAGPLSASPTPSPTNSTQLSPSASGFPDATTTGPVAGTVFKDFTGQVEIRQDGAVVNGWRVKGAVTVRANNVTIQNCDIDATGQFWGITLAKGYSHLKVTNCRIYGIPSESDYVGTHTLDGVAAEGTDLEVAFSDISGAENAIDTGTGYIHDNYIHDFADWKGRDNHDDGLQTYGWAGYGGLKVVHNTFIAISTGGSYTPTNFIGASSAMALSEGMHDLTIDNNLLAGGAYTLVGPSQAGSAPVNVHVTNNRFSRQYYPRCGAFGTHDGFNRKAPGFVWSGNVWHETGVPIPPGLGAMPPSKK